MAMGKHEQLRPGQKGIHQTGQAADLRAFPDVCMLLWQAAEVCPEGVSKVQRTGRGLPSCSGVMW